MAAKKKKTVKAVHDGRKLVREAARDIDYWDKLNEYDRKWLDQFCHEYYGNHHGRYGEESLITDEEVRKEARRLNNSYNRDGYNVALKTSQLLYNEDLENEKTHFKIYDQEEIETWQEAYTLQGAKTALEMVLADTLQQLEDDIDDDKRKTTLIRFFIKMRRLIIEVKKEERNDR